MSVLPRFKKNGVLHYIIVLNRSLSLSVREICYPLPLPSNNNLQKLPVKGAYSLPSLTTGYVRLALAN